MHLMFHLSSRSAKTVALLLASTALVLANGCVSGNSDAGTSNTNSSAVEAPGTTQVPADTAQFDSTQSSTVSVEAMGPKTIRLQREVTSQVKVSNLSDQAITNVTLMTTTPDGFQTTNVTGGTTQPSDTGRLVYAIGDLGPKESKVIQVSGMATKVGPIDTCFFVRFDPAKLCTAMNVVSPAFALAVNAPADTDICKPVTYTYTVTNTGVGTVHNVVVHEALPDGLMTTDGKSSVVANLADIPQGEKRAATAQLKASKTGSFTGQATATADADTAAPASTVTAVHAPVLAIAVTGGTSDFVGKQVGYQITITNKGDAPARNARVQISHVSGPGTVQAQGGDNSGSVALGDMEPNSTKTVTASGTSDQGGLLALTANASADCASAVSGTAQTQFNTIAALLLETVDETDPVKVGTTVIYDIKVTNQGSGPDTNVNVNATIPDGEEYVSTNGPTQPVQSGMGLTFPTIATLNPKESVTWKVTVNAVKAGDVQFKTSATSDSVKAGAEKTEPTKLY